MKKWIFILMIGLLAMACSSPPAPEPEQKQTAYQFADSGGDSVVVMTVADETPAVVEVDTGPVKWVDENFWNLIIGIVVAVYEFLALKIPTSRTVSILGNLYKLITWFIPDKSNKGTFDIRDKL